MNGLFDSAQALFRTQVALHTEPSRCKTAEEVADLTLGVHAARGLSPLPIALARMPASSAATGILRHGVDADIVRIRCMRKTLHILPWPLARVAHQATLHYRRRDALRRCTNLGITPRRLARGVSSIESLLLEGPLPTRELERQATSPKCDGGRRHLERFRAELKYAWEDGTVIAWNASRKWHGEERVYGLPTEPRHDLNQPCNEDAAEALLCEYFARYGPASVADACWWSALPQKTVYAHLAANRASYCELQPSWADSPLHGPTSSLELLEDLHRCGTGCDPVFLGHEDPLLKAYFETRKRYVESKHYNTLFNAIGEARPAIVRDGRVIGTWHWATGRRQATFALFDESDSKHDILPRFQRLATAIGAELAPSPHLSTPVQY